MGSKALAPKAGAKAKAKAKGAGEPAGPGPGGGEAPGRLGLPVLVDDPAAAGGGGPGGLPARRLELVRTAQRGGALVGVGPRDGELLFVLTRPTRASEVCDGDGNTDLAYLINRAADAGYCLVIRTDLPPIP